MTSKLRLVTVESGEVIVIKPPSFYYLQLFDECFQAIAQWRGGGLHPYWGIFIKLILDPICDCPTAFTQKDVRKILLIADEFRSIQELPPYPRPSDSPSIDIVSSGDDFCDRLASLLRQNENAFELFHSLDLNSIARILHQLDQYNIWESEQIKNPSERKKQPSPKMDSEDMKKAEEITRQVMSEMIANRRKSLEF